MSTRLTSSRSKTVTSTRPISSHQGTGYSGGGLKTSGGTKVISPLDHVAESFSQFLKENDDAPDHKIKEYKKKIMSAIQASSASISAKDPETGLQQAKEAETQLKALQDFLTSTNTEDEKFKIIKCTVLMQLAYAFKAKGLWEEAIHRYQRLLKGREYAYPQIIYLEIGNIYCHPDVHKYAEAVQNYEMGIVHLGQNSSKLQARFQFCSGVANLLQKDFSKALACFERSMQADPCIKTGFNLVLCHSILSSYDVLKDAFVRLLSVKPQAALEDISNSDILGNQLHVERRDQVRLVMLAARLVASKGPNDWQESYQFVLNELKKSKFPEAAGEFEIAFSLAYLNHKNADKAIEMLRQIRKKDPQLMALAATNLSFLYFLEQDIEQAEKYADIALEHDKYNAQALVNKGNCLMQTGKEEEARDSYLEAIGVEAECVEALYNLGIVSKIMGAYNEALQVFDKLSRIIEKSPEVDFEISDCYEKMGLIPSAIDWLHRLLNIMPKDPAAWRRLGSIWDKDGNETQAFHCYSESFKFCPSDIEVISWLGSYYKRHQHLDVAIDFFMRAAELQPKDPRLPLLVASCYKGMDMKKEALETYEKVLQMDNSNKQCLENLVKLTTEMGLTQKAEHYQTLLQDLNERLQMLQEEEMQAQMEQGYNEEGLGIGQQKFGYAMNEMNNSQGFGMHGLDGGFGDSDGIQFGGQMNPKPFLMTPERVEAPGLKVSKDGSNMVQTGKADETANMWEGVDFQLPE